MSDRLTGEDEPVTERERLAVKRAARALMATERASKAILDIDAHATPLGEDDDGFVTGGYLISVGSLHRALGVVGHPAAPCRDCEGHDAHDLRAANSGMWSAMQEAVNHPERWNEVLMAALDRYRAVSTGGTDQ